LGSKTKRDLTWLVLSVKSHCVITRFTDFSYSIPKLTKLNLQKWSAANVTDRCIYSPCIKMWSMIDVVTSVCNLGVTLDNQIQMTPHIDNLCKSASFSLKRRRYLDRSTAERLVHAFVSSRLDQCNSQLYGLPDTDISKLQMIQNAAARLITRTKKHEHITPILKELHWLPIRKRIIFKVLLLTFKCLHGLASKYLNELLTMYKPNGTLRSSSKLMLPCAKTKLYGNIVFYIYAPKQWNELPENIKMQNQ